MSTRTRRQALHRLVPRASTTALISRLDGSVAVPVGTVPASFPSADRIRMEVPLTLLGNDDGRMAFKVTSNQWVDASIMNTGVIDWMPDLNRVAGLVR
jgi:hypothetical protein